MERPGTPRGTAVVLTGRGEFIEKYATEIVGELMDRGFARTPWTGAARASPTGRWPTRKAHIDHFATYIADLALFLETIVAPAAPRPVIALCHSMGAHILLRYLAEHGSGPLAAGDMVSPDDRLHRETFLRSILMLMPEIAAMDDRYLFGTGPSSCSPGNSRRISSPTTSAATGLPTSGSPPIRDLPWAARPSAGPAKPCAR